jgi:RimJ/RimL family protein N-acetyltransferase
MSLRAGAERPLGHYTLPDGQTLFLRPIRPEDARELVAFFGRLSAETRHLRFFSYRQIGLAEAQSMATVDHQHSEAVVACVGPEPNAEIVGIANYDQSRPGAAEIAFTVEDRYQGRGLGHHLLDWIIARAQALGFFRLHGEALAANGRMLRLVATSGYPCRLRHDLDSCEFTLNIEATTELLAAA